MATVRGVTLTPGTVETVPADEAGSVTITTDGSAAVSYTLDGTDPTGSANVLPAGQPGSASHMLNAGAVKLVSAGSPTVTVAAYSPAEAEATPGAANAHAELQAGIDAAEATADNARAMVLNRDDRLEAVEYTAQQADEAHAALNARIDEIELTPGPQGEAGPQGAAGAAGQQGAQGIPGAAGAAGAPGSAGAAGASAYDLARAGGYGGAQTQWLATLKGADGAAGATGSQGAAGPTGPQGLQGTAGAAGAQGVKGDTGTAGAPGSAGAQGIQGLTGAQGIQGTQGIQGIQGPAGVALASKLTGAATNSAVAYAGTGLSVPVAAGKVYEIKAWGQYRTAALTTGLGLRLGGTCTATGVRYTATIWNASAPLMGQASALATALLSTAVAVANADYTWEIRGEIRVNAAGTLTVDFASEVAASLVTIQPDAYLLLTEI